MKGIHNKIIIIVFFFTLCFGIYSQTNRYVYKIPEKLDDGWEVASLKSVGIDTSQVEDLTGQIRTDEKFENMRSMLIVKNGNLPLYSRPFRWYEPGW